MTSVHSRYASAQAAGPFSGWAGSVASSLLRAKLDFGENVAEQHQNLVSVRFEIFDRASVSLENPVVNDRFK